jgi:A/G-specific adenine glycosylase
MLQQTQVERVVPAFERFVAAFPDFASLAKASRADVVRAWKGLGYNSRAVRLHELARAVCERHGNVLPNDEAALLALPGIGPYTARAILAFAFGASVVALDTNVRRVVHRTQLGLEHPSRASERELEALAAGLLPKGRGFAFNSALMDLGATICTARAPKCSRCPLRSRCAAAPVDPAQLARRVAEVAGSKPTRQRVPFESTSRYARGRVVDRLRALPGGLAISLLDLRAELGPLADRDGDAVEEAVRTLERDGLLELSGDAVRLQS